MRHPVPSAAIHSVVCCAETCSANKVSANAKNIARISHPSPDTFDDLKVPVWRQATTEMADDVELAVAASTVESLLRGLEQSAMKRSNSSFTLGPARGALLCSALGSLLLRGVGRQTAVLDVCILQLYHRSVAVLHVLPLYASLIRDQRARPTPRTPSGRLHADGVVAPALRCGRCRA